MIRKLLAFSLAITSLMSYSQESSADILQELKKLQNPARVLYLAAHPDDENTRMISYLVNELGVNTAYLSLTRGDGGQNLIGTELGAKLGVLRTQELMQARKLDGGQQFFTRAVDFGYSKTADETLRFWDEDAVLSDVVWVIRKFRPDVIITRFPPDGRGGHGHHTASAMLAMQAFDMAGDDNAFPEQLKHVSTWQPRRLYWNASTWWNPKLDSIAAADPDYLKVEVGGYNPITGLSNNELASMSRTQHKSQGFGVSISRGAQAEYLKFLMGDRAREDLFENIPTQWERYDYEDGDELLEKILAVYNPQQPAEIIPMLIELLDDADDIENDYERAYFEQQVEEIILMAAGWHSRLISSKEFVNPGEDLSLTFEAINRSDFPIVPKSMQVGKDTIIIDDEIVTNEIYRKDVEISVDADISQPYWLRNPYDKLFKVEDQLKIGKPENDPSLNASITLLVAEEEITVPLQTRYRFSDRVEGEISRPVAVVPAITVNPSKENLMFANDQAQNLQLEVRYFSEVQQVLKLQAPGFKVEPEQITLKKPDNGNKELIEIRLSPKEPGSSVLKITDPNGTPLQSITEIDYRHIDKRVVFEPAQVKLINPELSIVGSKIGYITGAGDKVAKAIEQMGYEVDLLSESDLQNKDLSQYQAIVAGIRAYNTQEWLPAAKSQLNEYIKQGGVYLVQYNTASRDLLTQDLGPYPFTISRQRVTEETAAVNFVNKDHPVLNKPNDLSKEDFEDWVQERGLYFASEWDERYQTPLSWHDKNEDPLKGGLLIGDYGKGAFIYTGISFFRELPAGVEGAYRLLANLLSYQNPASDEQ